MSKHDNEIERRAKGEGRTARSGPSGAAKQRAEESPRLVDELKKMEREPLLPVEKKLILWSVGLGVVALGLLVWLSYTFFPSGR